MIQTRFALDEHRVAELSGMPVGPPDESGSPLSVHSDLPAILQRSRRSTHRCRRPERIGILEESIPRGKAPPGTRIDGHPAGVRIQAQAVETPAVLLRFSARGRSTFY